MLIDNYIQRQIGEYEALNHRASAALDLLKEQKDANQHLVEDAGRVIANHHAARIRRIQTQIAYHLRSRPDLLGNIDQYNKHNVDQLFKIQAATRPDPDIITRALEQTHTNEEADHVALLVMSVANLQAMTQINAEILSRDNEDNLTRAYQDVLFTLLQDTEHSQIQRELNPMDAGRMQTLGVEEIAKMAEQATERAREMANTQQTREFVATADLLEHTKQYANSTMPATTQIRFPLRELTDSEVAATADGARVFTGELRKLGLKWLSDADHIAANAAHLVAEQFTEHFEFDFEHRMLPQEFDDPDDRVLTPKRYVSAIKPAIDLGQATAEIRQLPLGQEHNCYTHDMTVKAAALSGHAAALQWHVQRIRDQKPRQVHQPYDHATASWVHENTIRRILEDQPTPPTNLRKHWARAGRALHEFDNLEDDLCIETMRPEFHSPTVTSALDHPEPSHVPMEPQPLLEREKHQMPQEWTISYQYQDAYYAKRIGEPYHHQIDAHTARQHALNILNKIQNGNPDCEPEYVHHLERMTILAHQMAASGLQSMSENDLTNAIETAFRYIPRSTAIHRIIDDLAGHRPTAAAHLKAISHPGSHLLTEEQTNAILGAARAAGVHEIVLNEVCHRLQITPELQHQLSIPQTFHVNREHAEHVVKLILDLSPTAYSAASTAAEEMGWTIPELTRDLYGPDDYENEDDA